MQRQQSFQQFDQVSVLSENSVPAEADRILILAKTTPQLSPSDHQHSMAAHLKDNVGGHLVDRGEVKELQESANQLEYKLTSTDKLLPRSEDELISEKSYDIDLKAGNLGNSNGFEDELRKVSKQPGSGVPSHFHSTIPTLLQSAHLDDRQVGHLDGSNADHSCHLTHRSPDHSCGHHRHHMMPMSSPVSAISTSVELAGHSTVGLSGDEPMVSYTCEDIHQEQSTDSVMILPDMFLKKVKPDDGQIVAGNDHHVQSELRKTTKRPSSGGPSLQHNDVPDSIVTSTSRALNRLDPPVKSGSNHNTFTYSTASGGKSDQVPHDKPADASYLQSLAKTSAPPHSGSSSKNHNSVSNLVASE